MTERTPGPEAARGVSPGSSPAGPAAHAHPHEHGDDTEPHAENDCAMTAGPHVTDATGVTTRGDAAVSAEARAGYDVDAGIAALWRQFADGPDQASRDRLVLHYPPLGQYLARPGGTRPPAPLDPG